MFEAVSSAGLIVVLSLVVFWIGMLGMLWRRSLIGMLIGLLFAWIAVSMVAVGFALMQTPEKAPQGGALVLCLAVLGGLQISVGLAIVAARIRRRGTMDADDAGLLEG